MKKITIPSNIKKPIFFLLGALITYNILRVLKMYFDSVKANVNQAAIKHITGASAADIKLCKDVALKCYDAIYNFSFGWFENERGFVAALNELSTPQQAKATSLFYKEMAKKTSLKDDMFKYLDSWQYTDINSTIRANLQ